MGIARTRRSGLLGVLLLVVSACSSAAPATSATAPAASTPVTGSTAPSSSAQASTAAPATIRVSLNWTVPAGDWPGIFWAQSKGYYDEANLKVELQFLQGSALSIQAVGAGTSDLGIADSGSGLTGMSQGLPIVAVANQIRNTPTGIIWDKSKHTISAFTDLKGLTISSATASPEPALLQAQLVAAGLNPDSDVKFVYVDPQAKCTVLLAGKSDVCTGFSTFQLLQVLDKGVDAGFLSFSTPQTPVLGHSTFANKDYLAKNPDVVKRFLAATMRGYYEALQDANLDPTVEIVTKAYPESDKALLKGAYQQYQLLNKDQQTDGHAWGWMSDTPWENLQKALLGAKLIKQETPVSAVYTNDYLPDAAFTN